MNQQAKAQTAITPTRAQDYPEWYQQVIKAAELAETSAVRGCMVIKPWGYAIWENIQKHLDAMFKETGHVNAYFPLFIPVSYLAKEAEHVEGFAKECAVVTHHRLVPDLEKGGLKPASPLDEPLVVRPTSETIIGETYAKWVQSYRDLPILINQWANVVRWEMRTRLFLRTSEFLWQEGHTVHATAEEAVEETLKMLDVYADFAENYMAMPVIRGEKTASERFPGAVNTYAIEAMMQDGKALQAGTSHFLGQNFARAAQIKFLNRNEKEEIAWTTSWGVSTRLIGGMIMTHSDDDGLVIPPRLAPKQVVLVPIYKSEDERASVMDYCQRLASEIRALRYADDKITVEIDAKDTSGGTRAWQAIKKGVPVRLEIGPRDIAKDSVFMGRRDFSPKDKKSLTRTEFLGQLPTVLAEMHTNLFERALKYRREKSVDLHKIEDFNDYFAENKADAFGYVLAADNETVMQKLKDMKLTARCMPLERNSERGSCIFTGAKDSRLTLIARSY